MKLTPIAKPVRIRIKSGNEEHSSLESLRNHFVWEDVSVLLDGRLDKWLRRINENEIADKIQQIPNPKNKMLEVYCALFRIERLTDDDIFKSCCEIPSFVSLAKDRINKLSLSKLIQFRKKYMSCILETLEFDKILTSRAATATVDESASVLFQVGEYLYNIEEYEEAGKRCIFLAADKGLKEAVELRRRLFLTFGSS